MKKYLYIRKKTLITLMTIVFTLVAAFVVYAATSDPGTQENPLVSKDYVDSKIAEIPGVQTSLYQKVELTGGKSMICSGSTEIILRAGGIGKVKVIANSYGDGLSDITSGSDLRGGAVLQLNHLNVVPLSDGRGIKVDPSVTETVYFIVKGNYTIK